MRKATVLLLGKLPPPYMGPAIATKILLSSDLARRYRLVHLDTNVHKDLRTLGTFGLGKTLKNLAIFARMVGVIRKTRPDIALIPISQDTLGFVKDSVFILLAAAFGVTNLVHLRGSNLQNWLAEASPVTRRYFRMVMGRADGAIVLGQKLTYLFEGFFKPDRIFVIPNGADYPDVVPNDHSHTNNSPLRVLYLANLQPSKGIEDVVEGFKVLKSKNRCDIVLDVVGEWRDEPTRNRCLEMVDNLELSVRFHGPAYDKEKHRFLNSADIFVFVPRMPEGHPWVVVEALAHGLPAIATDQGAISESIRDGYNGYVVPVKSPALLAERIEYLADNPKLRKEFGDRSRRLYETDFTEEVMVDRISSVVDSLVKETTAGA